MKTKYSVLLLISLGFLSCKSTKQKAAKSEKEQSDSAPKTSEKEMKTWVKLDHPGGPKAPPSLVADLQKAVKLKAEKKSAFRTKHKEGDMPLFTNRLVLETSPYLQQHAHNPVNWYSWGDEAFEVAATTGRPVFLSIGYSTCHWCHVMEEESFEDLEIAKYLNENFIAIKVDREERPDIDDIYMKAVTIFRGRGGWPMSVWLTEERTPYDGGTYFPARTGDRGSGIGYLQLLKKNKVAYSDPATLIKAQLTTEKIAKNMVVPSVPNARLEKRSAPLTSAVSNLARSFDGVNGGWGRTTKFPMPSRLRFLLRYYRRSGEKPDMLFDTLDAMAAGGINDQIGGGFHRYTVDPKWTVPHFEKMLYDNAQLALLYTEAYQFTRDDNYKRVAMETLDYLEKEMLDKNGALFAATDADSEGEEGTFFVWAQTEFDELFGKDSKLASQYFGVSAVGNFEGKNILTRRDTKKILEDFSIDEEDLRESVFLMRDVLYRARKLRTPPDRDDKIITAWNALAVDAFATAGFVFSESKYTHRAEKILSMLDRELFQDGVLYRSGISTDANGISVGRQSGQHNGFKKGPVGVAEDYAFTIHAALKMFQFTGEVRWFKQAEKLQIIFDENFLNSKGVYFRRSKLAPPELVNAEAWKDGAVPSANGYAAMNAMIWQRITTDDKWETRADQIFGAYSNRFRRGPLSSPTMLVALDGYADKSKEVFVVGTSTTPEGDEMVDQLRRFHPNATFFSGEEGASATQIKAVPWLAKKVPKEGKVTAYVCHKFVCKLPTIDPEVFLSQLNDFEKL